MRKLGKIIGIIFGVIAALLLVAFVVGAAVPLPTDPQVDMANHGAGSSSVAPAYTGLQREYPPSNEPADNPTTPEKAELGRILFFDPVLSENNDVACATCHHPDYGFSDGRATSMGTSGVELARNALTLWDVAYVKSLFWDGRVDNLEDQALVPLTHADEMAVGDTAAMAAELAAIPEYVALFDAAFGGGAASVTADNTARALAAFQRTLISDDAPFDRYAAGDFDALTTQQRRGLALFRSGALRCFECHGAPTFASDTFRVIGIDSEDPGRAGVVPDGLFGAFKVPTLRNIALSAPYMHDGSMATLEEVVRFYEGGGGRARGVQSVDVFVNPFELSDQDRADLISFLYALTDESNNPAIPAAVPSGLPVVAPYDNPARAEAALHNTAAGGAVVEDGPPQTITVQAGETIQAAVDRARPGDTVEIPYGIYHERVVIDMSDFTLRGIPNDKGEYPILDGEGKLPEGVIASGNNFTVGNLHTRNYTDNGVLVEGVTGVHFHDIFAENVGTYGIYPVRSSDVLIERVEVTGVDDAGIYAGQSENVIVRDSTAYGNVIGIELENTLGGELYNNHLHDNSNGILLVLLPQLSSKISSGAIVRDNLVENNNIPNFAPEGGMARIVPPGTGILIIGSDNNEIFNNTITGNKTAGIAVFSLTGTGAFNENELDVGPLAENNFTHNNTFSNNGFDPDPAVAALGIPAGDILWDTTGVNNRFNESGISGGFPPLLPGDNWPGFVRNAYGNLWRVLVSLIG
ncbi:MAG: right-handed parallel beta-helix repeat-containing protein [Candidatus Promineofilum sp.]|nr:right-handed parallel beta-helix repeat-containing protein [Promineifilum sp.]MBP9658052.1 right-handed parallel beta-helix repeat-containing protein [Promineifilum sp.]